MMFETVTGTRRCPTRSRTALAVYDLFRTMEDTLLFVAVVGEEHAFCRAFGREAG